MGKSQSKTDHAKVVSPDTSDGFVEIKEVEAKEKNKNLPNGGQKKKEKKSASESVVVVFEWPYDGNEVSVSGSFNDWSVKLPLQKSDGKFKTSIALLPGSYEYKFVVDGQWNHDKNKDTIVDHFGGSNNVIAVIK